MEDSGTPAALYRWTRKLRRDGSLPATLTLCSFPICCCSKLLETNWLRTTQILSPRLWTSEVCMGLAGPRSAGFSPSGGPRGYPAGWPFQLSRRCHLPRLTTSFHLLSQQQSTFESLTLPLCFCLHLFSSDPLRATVRTLGPFR